ncbi:MAG: hypothetical protein ACOY0T_29575 [Myxococcota bacterium]
MRRWDLLGQLLACVLCTSAVQAQSQKLSFPRRGETPEVFVPAGWSSESSLAGDLDADGVEDLVQVLLQNERPEGGDRERALVILLRRGDRFVLGGSNSGLLTCFECAGVKGGTGAPDLEIKRGVLLVSQMGGSRQFSITLDRFRWSRARQRFELIGADVSYHDALTGESAETSCNLLTGECIETTTPAQVDDEGNPRERPPKTRHWKTGKKPLQPLERVRAAQD